MNTNNRFRLGWVASAAAAGLLFTLSAAAQAPSTEPAPIVRLAPGTVLPSSAGTERLRPAVGTLSARPQPGIELRVAPGSDARVLSSTPARTEIRLTRGIANLQVHDPAPGALILVDLPGGQVQPLEDGVYTFNAATGTLRVLHGEADAFPGDASKPLAVKDGQQLVFSASSPRPASFAPGQAFADLIPGDATHGDGGPRYNPYPPAYGFYGPYGPYAWDGPWYGPWAGWGYPFGYGFSFGYYGGWGGGFVGRGFHGR